MANTPKYANEIMDKLIRIEANQDHMAKRLDDVHNCLFGNDKPEYGLAHRFYVNESKVKTAQKLSLGAIGSVITGIIGYILSLIF